MREVREINAAEVAEIAAHGYDLLSERGFARDVPETLLLAGCERLRIARRLPTRREMLAFQRGWRHARAGIIHVRQYKRLPCKAWYHAGIAFWDELGLDPMALRGGRPLDLKPDAAAGPRRAGRRRAGHLRRHRRV